MNLKLNFFNPYHTHKPAHHTQKPSHPRKHGNADTQLHVHRTWGRRWLGLRGWRLRHRHVRGRVVRPRPPLAPVRLERRAARGTSERAAGKAGEVAGRRLGGRRGGRHVGRHLCRLWGAGAEGSTHPIEQRRRGMR